MTGREKLEKIVKGLTEALMVIEVRIPKRYRGYSIEAIKDALALLKAQEQVSFEGTFLNREDYVNIGDIIDCLTGLTLSTDAAFQTVGLIEWAMGKRAISKDTMLKAQEPRVMSLEEVQALHANDVVWLKDKDKPNIIPGIVRNRHLWPHSVAMVTNFMRGDGCKVTAGDDDYGKRWRCWTSRPTEEQREAVKWE